MVDDTDFIIFISVSFMFSAGRGHCVLYVGHKVKDHAVLYFQVIQQVVLQDV